VLGAMTVCLPSYSGAQPWLVLARPASDTASVAGRTSRNRRDLGLAFASVVLFLNGLPIVLAAIVNLVFGRTLTNAGLGLLLAPIGVGMIWAAICLRPGRRRWWLASLILLPVAAAAQFFDAYALGKGEFPLYGGS
jgi:hypothetical protein